MIPIHKWIRIIKTFSFNIIFIIIRNCFLCLCHLYKFSKLVMDMWSLFWQSSRLFADINQRVNIIICLCMSLITSSWTSLFNFIIYFYMSSIFNSRTSFYWEEPPHPFLYKHIIFCYLFQPWLFQHITSKYPLGSLSYDTN